MMDEWNRNKSLPPDHGDVERDAKKERNAKKPAGKRRTKDAARKKALDDNLDRALEDSFPGSDPVALTQPPSSARDKRRR